MQSQPVTILIADSHPLFRDGLKAHLSKVQDFRVIGEEENGRNALQACLERKPNVVIVDIFSADFFGMGGIKSFHQASSKSAVLIASDRCDQTEVHAAFRQGASGYIMKNASSDDFINAVRVVATSGCYIPAFLMACLLDATKKMLVTGNMFALTNRETDVLRELSLGRGNKEIADKLGLSIRTVETHRMNIRQKTGTFALADLIKIAVKLGLIKDSQMLDGINEAAE